jgi:outer membrane protein OmpA-like peptidoglycan-associated protein
MPTRRSCATIAAPSRPRRLLAAAAATATAALLGACTTLQPQVAERPTTTETPSTEAQPFDAAMNSLATALIARAQLDPSEQRILVVDPPVDLATVRHTAVTQDVERRIVNVVGQRFPNLQPTPLGETTLERQPVVVLSCMTPVAGPGEMRPSIDGSPKTYRVWASLSDTRTGKIVSSETVWVRAEDVDVTPTKFFRDSPAWAMDNSMRAYLKVCGGKPGEAMDPAYLSGMGTSAVVNRATAAYEAGRYPEALAYYTQASQLPGGDQMRVWNGAYLTNVALGHTREAEEAFGKMVDAGLAQGKLAVKFVFRPASVQFWPDRAVSGQYPAWIRQIAQRSVARKACLLVVGHSSPTGTPAANEVLSERRAQFVRQQIVQDAMVLRTRTEARGRGAREPLVGTGKDNASDVLDRRVEFEPRACGTLQADRMPGRV